MEDITKKNCGMCKHFVQHYIKENGHLSRVNYGICKKHGRNNERLFICEYWEDNAEVLKARKQSVKTVLQEISERLNQAIMILIDDNE